MVILHAEVRYRVQLQKKKKPISTGKCQDRQLSGGLGLYFFAEKIRPKKYQYVNITFVFRCCLLAFG